MDKFTDLDLSVEILESLIKYTEITNVLAHIALFISGKPFQCIIQCL